MNLLPYERLKIRTMLSTKEAREKLDGVIELRRNAVWFEVNHKPYQGKVDDSQFEVVRVIHYRNPFVPIIKGDIQPETSGCSIHITMYPIGIFIAPAIIVLGFVGYHLFAAAGSLFSSALHGNLNDPSIVLGLGMAFVLIYAIFIALFKFESMTAKEFFCELFQAEVVEKLGIGNPFRAAG